MGAFKLLLVTIGLFAFAVAYNWSDLDRLVIALVLILIVAWIWSRDSLNRIGLRRSLSSDRVRMGEIVEEEIELTNHVPWPRLWIEVQDHGTLPAHNAGAVVSVRGKGTSTWRTRTFATRRGVYRLGPFTVHGGDPFGLFEKQRLIPVEHTLVVFPPRLDVSNVPMPVATMSGGAMRDRSRAQASQTVASIREYTPGDPLNHISWSATARRGAMMVKEFDPDPTADLWIVLDLGERGQFDLERPKAVEEGDVAAFMESTVDYIVAVGGSIAERALDEGRKVGLVVNRAMPIRLDADDTQRQWFRIFEVLATASAFGNRSLAEALTAESSRFNRTTGVIVITSDPSTDWVPAARSLIQRRVAVTAVLVDAGGRGEDSVAPLIEALASARVAVTRYPTHTAGRDIDKPFPVHAT
ncbi:MAG TPA: DUF58 domain-containing protein [Thermomicrobiales bacterium]|nr:DUF58 domain-containing protein [Thermomicrobiales bacterium]